MSLVRELVLVKREARVQINTSYCLPMFLHGMLPSYTIGKWNTFIGAAYNSAFNALLPWSMFFIAYSDRMGHLLVLEELFEV